MSTCIYCRVEGEPGMFNREHVLQQGFGRFKGAPVLHDAVCAACNTYFGRTLDVALTRESAEGLERYRWGTKPPSDVAAFRHTSVTLRADDANEYTGAEVRLAPDESAGGLVARFHPGAAIRNAADAEFTHFTADDIRSGRWATPAVDWRRGVKLFGSAPAVAELREALERQGVRAAWRPLERPAGGARPEVPVTHEFTITDAMRRGYAKIAFNYLAWRQGPVFALGPAFDPIRRFVRDGIEPATPPVDSNWQLPFRVPAGTPERPVVHWVSITSHSTHRNLLGVVLLYGFMRHTILLAQDYAGPWPEWPQAHLFNVRNHTAYDTTPAQTRRRDAETG